MIERVIVPDLAWEFDDGPRYLLAAGKYKRAQKVDPTPAYANDAEVIAKTLALCEAKFPVSNPPVIFSLRHEVVGRTNGWTGHDSDYDDTKKDQHGRHAQLPYIVLSGKRIPPHPAMTRYLVAHEYGHVVDYFLAYKRFAGNDPTGEQDKEYGALRGLAKPPYYGPGTWHVDPGEVFANDFRILVCGVEPEYWPHPGVPRPEECYAARGWWAARLEEMVPTKVAA